jgi:hypothetical protein
LLAGAHQTHTVDEMLPLVRIAALTFATTSVVALDDPSSPVTHATPPGRLQLRLVAAASTLVVSATLWATLVVLADRLIAGSLRAVLAGAAVELLAMFCVGLATGAAMDRATTVRLAPAWGAAVLVSLFALTLTDTHMRAWLWVDPGPQWQPAHARWAVLAGVAVAAFAWSSRDPASRVRHRRGNGAASGATNRSASSARQRHDMSV